jgi:ABC-2 type transport system ATP-binding protein
VISDLPFDATSREGLVTVETGDPTRALHELTGWAVRRGMEFGSLTVDRPSLEDVYLRLTGDDQPAHVMEMSNR